MENLLVADKLTKKYADKIALNQFDISIPKGSIYGLLGPNGAGKTTFLRIINQITAADSGTVTLNGEPLAKEMIKWVGYMPEERGLYKNMKVSEQALYFARLKGLSVSEAKSKIQYWFDKLGITPWMNKKLSELSKGMGQKVQFVITVIHDPKLLIFDEPFSGFDPVNAQLIANEILNLKAQGTTIIFSTHRMESVEEMCDYVALINQSNKILDGPVKEVQNQFKTGKFNVSLKDVNLDIFEKLSRKFEIESFEKSTDNLQFFLTKPQNTTVREVMNELLNAGDIIGFNESIPSMNEVFIKAVENSNKTNN